MSEALTIPSGISSYLLYQEVTTAYTQEEEDEGDAPAEWLACSPEEKAQLLSIYDKEMTMRVIGGLAAILLTLGAATTGGLYLGEIITTQEMIPLATTLGSLYFLFVTRIHSNVRAIGDVCLLMTVVALGVLVSEKLLDPLILTPLIFGMPLVRIISSVLPPESSDPPKHEALDHINFVMTLIFNIALASILLFTNYLSVETAAALFLGSCILTNLLKYPVLPWHDYKLTLPLLLIEVAAAVLVFFHLLSEQYLIGYSILYSSLHLSIGGMMTYYYFTSS